MRSFSKIYLFCGLVIFTIGLTTFHGFYYSFISNTNSLHNYESEICLQHSLQDLLANEECCQHNQTILSEILYKENNIQDNSTDNCNYDQFLAIITTESFTPPQSEEIVLGKFNTFIIPGFLPVIVKPPA